MEKKMTTEQALNILSQVAAQFRGTLDEHNTLQTAIETIKEATGSKTDRSQ